MSEQGKPAVVVASCNHRGNPAWPAAALYVLARPSGGGAWAVWYVKRWEPKDDDPKRTRVAQPHPAWPDSDPMDVIGQEAFPHAAGRHLRDELIPVLHADPWKVDCPHRPGCQAHKTVRRAWLVALASHAVKFEHRGFYF